MKFCEKCDNMYYLKLQEADSDQLVYYCRNCGYIDNDCLLYTSPSPRDPKSSRMPSSA